MESTFDDIKKFIIKNGINENLNDISIDIPQKGQTKNFYMYHIDSDRKKDTLVFCHFKVNDFGDVEYEKSDATIGYDENSNTLKIYNDVFNNWRTIEFDENGHYIDPYSNKEYFPLHYMKFFNSEKDADKFIGEYKTVQKDHYLKMIQWWIDIYNEDIDNHINQISEIQRYISKKHEIIHNLEEKKIYIDRPIPDYLENIRQNDMYVAANRDIVKAIYIYATHILWKVIEHNDDKEINVGLYKTYLNGEVDVTWYDDKTLLKVTAGHNYDIVKKCISEI